ncbi:MAG TPA: hypothetical protein VJZ71_16705 [Phycisphaerae bacterium]|nr:hypothetical protein [Phycisphaerae bacterium]
MSRFQPSWRKLWTRVVVVIATLALLTRPRLPIPDVGGTGAGDRVLVTHAGPADMLAITPSKSSSVGDFRDRQCYQPVVPLAASYDAVLDLHLVMADGEPRHAFTGTLDRRVTLCRWLI